MPGLGRLRQPGTPREALSAPVYIHINITSINLPIGLQIFLSNQKESQFSHWAAAEKHHI